MSWKSVTRFLFVTTQLAAILWVSISYGVAIYATVRLQQPFPVVELSSKAIDAILGGVALKTISNVAEHNDGWLFGKSKTEGGEEDESEYQPGDPGEGVG